MIRHVIRRLFIVKFSFSDSVSGTRLEKATFAGGCFWCIESAFEHIPGVVEAVSGYTGGHTANPTYEEVSTGRTGHFEAVEVTYDPAKIGYSGLLDVFWSQIDPTDNAGQFADHGSQYRTAIFYHNEEQKRLSEESKKAISGKFGKPVVTEIRKAGPFYRAEEYHQDYYKKNAQHYEFYREHSGRGRYVSPCASGVCPIPDTKAGPGDEKPSEEDLKLRLSPLQYHVTQECGTERPFDNEYWNNKREGIYVDVVSGEVLFSSKDKFDSGTGWPSFTKPLEPGNIEQETDRSHNMVRTEVKSRHGRSHLGHVFDDGPAPTHKRYCMNSASLRFIPREDLEKEGYGEYLKDFLK